MAERRAGGVITFRVMMEVLVVVKILRSRPLPLDDRKKGLPPDDKKNKPAIQSAFLIRPPNAFI